jgi:hypothetical protein
MFRVISRTARFPTRIRAIFPLNPMKAEWFSSSPMHKERNAPKGFEEFFKLRKNEPKREDDSKEGNEPKEKFKKKSTFMLM